MPLAPLNEPPAGTSLTDARRELDHHRESLTQLNANIDAAEVALAQLVSDSKRAISDMQHQRTVLEDKIFKAKAYISPMRRLPGELLRQIFLWNFEAHPCCAWVLAAVCTLWRRQALSMHRIWSKIRLLTTQSASPDIIRLWLERSGNKVRLDIEIYLRVNKKSTESHLRSRATSPSPWGPPFPHHAGGTAHYVIPHPPHLATTIPMFPSPHAPILIPPSPPTSDGWSSPPRQVPEKTTPTSRRSKHWGHIAIYYLVEQIHRWERFVFRFDKQFASMDALKSITGDAPNLREFEVSCGEAAFYASGEMPWLPSANAHSLVELPRLITLTLQNTPFRWSSPMLRPNLRSLNLRSLPTTHLALDRILYIISSNPSLETLLLQFVSVLPAILPLSTTSLSELKEFSIGGHYLLSQLVDSLTLPSLDSLSIDIEARDPIEDTISNLLARSNNPALTHLAVAYGNTTSSSFYYGPGGVVISWAVLGDLNSLESLHVGGTPLEPLLTALGPPDEDHTHWACPNITSLAMKNCHAHSDGISKLVQMVDARNPESSSVTMTVNGVAPVRLKHLEMYDCASLGQDIIKWLKGRVEDVVCVEPAYERSPITGGDY